MSYHPSQQPPVVSAALHVPPQGAMMPGYLPTGLPPPPMPPPFPGFPVGPPAQPVMQPVVLQNTGRLPMQPPRLQFNRKPEMYDKKHNQYRPVIGNDKPTVTVFVGNITEHASDALIRQLLMKCGIVVNWKRVQGADGKLQAFGFCEYSDAEAGLRAIRLLHDLSVGEKNLVVKVDAKTKEMLEEYKKKKATEQEGKTGENKLVDPNWHDDDVVKKNITGLLTDNGDVLSGKFAGTASKWKASHSGSEENLEGMGMDKDKKHLISREIRFFRDAYKDSEKEKKDKSKSQDKELEKENKERSSDKDRDRERDRGRDRSRDRSPADRDDRSRNDERNGDRGRSRDRDRGREDRDKDRRQTRDRELDEDEQYEKRKRERRLKERNQAFVERLKTWEARERKRNREYERELEKDRELENEQAREKKHLLEFLEDYDDEQDDPKYYRGNSFDRRLQARLGEMESDDKDRQRELEEIEEIKKTLGDRAVVPEEPMEVEPVQEQLPTKPEPEPEQKPTLQATFKPAIHVVESAPKVISPVQDSPKNSPKTGTIPNRTTQEDNTEVDGETAGKKTFVFEMKAKSAVSSSNPNRKKLEAVFNSEEDSGAQQGSKRKLVPLDYSEEEMKAVGNPTGKTAEDKKKSIKSLIERIPTAKDELFSYSLDWNCVDQTLIDRRIRPWVNKKIVEYIGEEEPSLVDFMCSKLLARSQPENILRDVSMVLDDEAEVFVVKMWRLLIYETEAKKIGLVK